MARLDEGARSPSRFGAPFVRTSSFIRKELAELIRQPRMLALLVIGPFTLLGLFGAGYSQSDLVLRALFVGPEGSVYEDVLATYEEDMGDFIEPMGFLESELVATKALYDGEVDVVVVFPDDPVETVLSGERALVRVLHDEIDPLQQTAIWVATKMAVAEVNANVLSAIASEAQDRLAPATEIVATLADLATEIDASDGDTARLGAAVEETGARLDELSVVVDGSSMLLDRLDTVTDDVTELDEARAAISDLRGQLPAGAGLTAADVDDIDTTALAADLRTFSDRYAELTTLDPAVLTRPFDSTTESILPVRVDQSDYFVPASLALLLQHLGVTFAALSLVRDRSTGLFELLRVSPLSPWEIVTGKCIAYLLMGGAVAAILLALSVVALGVPMAGAVVWLAVVVVGLVLASLALGMILSMVSGTESQAVQYAMLSLLAGLFFSGFVLSIDDLVAPVRVISFALPVTYGIRAFQDVMFRGLQPSWIDLGGLIGLSALYGTLAVMALRSKLRIT